jgi:hypothetical protein
MAVLMQYAATMAQENRIDLVRYDAPVLAALGESPVGVRTVSITDTNRPDILALQDDETAPTGDRTLTVEVWYPAAIAPDHPGLS